MSDSCIFVSNLVKQFGDSKQQITAVDQLSLQVDWGETYGLIGPDGAGKSTAIRLILGLLCRTSGTSRVCGYDSMTQANLIHEQIGYIAQSNVLPGDLTVMENMAFFADLHGVPRNEQKTRISELLAFADLLPFSTRLAKNLSGGMKKKLALASCLIHNPRVVFFDEPTLGVDPASRREFWNILGNLRAEKGLTIFMSTPYMDEAERCTKVGLIASGKLIASDTPEKIKTKVVGQLIEFVPSAFLPAKEICSKIRGVLEVQTFGEKLHVFVEDISTVISQIQVALDAENIGYEAMRPIDVRMEEAYINLFNRFSKPIQE